MNDLYKRWFAKSNWTVSDAGLLLYGFNPEEWDHAVPKSEHQRMIAQTLASWDYVNDVEGFQSLLHDVRDDLINDVSPMRRGEGDLIDPLKVAQWAYDVRKRFWFSTEFLHFIEAPENGINYRDNTWIDRDYLRWSKMDTWEMKEAKKLLLGEVPGRDYGLRSWHLNDLEIQTDIHGLIYRAVVAGHLTQIISADKEYYLPKEITKWAQDKGIPVPPKLLEYLGLKSFNNNPSLVPEKRCEEWLKSLAQKPKTKSKEEYRLEAKQKFSVGANAFNRAWSKATENTDWIKPGALKKKSNS